MPIDLDALRRRIPADVVGAALTVEGRVVSVRGATLRAAVPGVRVGDLVHVERGGDGLRAEVVGFEDALAVLVPLGETVGVGVEDVVRPVAARNTFPCGVGCLGRVLGSMGEAIDGRGPIEGEVVACPLERAPPDPLRRARVREVLPLGVRALDGLATVGVGQRVGVFASAGAGKSVLLAQVARTADVDAVVVGLIGERGREVRDFIDGALGDDGMRRACVVVATSDEAPALRVRAAKVAVSVAEHLRDAGQRVLLLLDSATRVARAQRDLGLAAGEAPVRRAFPPSVFTLLPRLFERMGCDARGSITALVTVLLEGDERDDPVAEEVRGLLDGHVMLDRALGARGRWPAVDVLASLSRVMDGLVDDTHRAAAVKVRAWLAALEANRELVAMGAYAPGRDKTLDEALARRDAIERFLRQPMDERARYDETVRSLVALAR